MNEKTYHQAKKYINLIDILKLIGSRPKGFTAQEITSELSLNKTTCLSILEALTKEGFVETYNNHYIIGNEASKLWSSRVAILKRQQEQINKDLSDLGVK